MTDAVQRALVALGSFPDRAKIESLCMLVDDVLGDPTTMNGVAAQFIGRLHAADPTCKLPVLYSIDFIAKKLGVPFQSALRPYIADAVLAAHAVLPQPLQLKVRSMVGTWVDQKVFPSETALIQARLGSAQMPAQQPVAVQHPPTQQMPLQPQPMMMMAHGQGYPYPVAGAAHAPVAGGYGQKVPFSVAAAAGGMGSYPNPAAHVLSSSSSLPPGAIPISSAGPAAKRPRMDQYDAAPPQQSQSYQQAPAPSPVAPAAASTLGRLLAGLKGGGAGATSQATAAPSVPTSGTGLPSFFPNVATPSTVLPSVGFCAVPALDPTGRPLLTPDRSLPAPPGAAVRDNLPLPSLQPQQPQQQQADGSAAPPLFPMFVVVEPEEDPYQAISTEIGASATVSLQQAMMALSIKNGAAINNLYCRQPYRCSQCGQRFPKQAEAQAHERIHVGDPLLILAQQQQQGGGAAAPVKLPMLSRQWYVPEDAWLRNDGRGGLQAAQAAASGGAADGSSSSSSASMSSPQPASSLPSLPGSALGGRQAAGSLVSLSPSSEGDSDDHGLPAYDPTAVCAVCGEGFDRKWDDQLETFVLKGAVSRDGEIYHRSCASTLDPAASTGASANRR